MTVSKALPKDLIDGLLANYKKPEDLIGENGLLKQLTKGLVERALEAEMAEHLGHDKHEPVKNATGNTRNGKSRKTLKGDFGEMPIEIPRDRAGSFGHRCIVHKVKTGQFSVGRTAFNGSVFGQRQQPYASLQLEHDDGLALEPGLI